MVNKTSVKLYDGKGSYTLALKKSFINDSACKIKPGDKLDIQMVDSFKMLITVADDSDGKKVE